MGIERGILRTRAAQSCGAPWYLLGAVFLRVRVIDLNSRSSASGSTEVLAIWLMGVATAFVYNVVQGPTYLGLFETFDGFQWVGLLVPHAACLLLEGSGELYSVAICRFEAGSYLCNVAGIRVRIRRRQQVDSGASTKMIHCWVQKCCPPPFVTFFCRVVKPTPPIIFEVLKAKA